MCVNFRLCSPLNESHPSETATGGSPARAPFNDNVSAGGLLEGNALYVKVAVWLNDTGLQIHMEPTMVIVYRLEVKARTPREGRLVSFQKRLLGGVTVRHMKRSAARHTTHRENVHGDPFAIQFDGSFVPIHLRLASPFVRLRNECRAPSEPTLLSTSVHSAAPSPPPHSIPVSPHESAARSDAPCAAASAALLDPPPRSRR